MRKFLLLHFILLNCLFSDICDDIKQANISKNVDISQNYECENSLLALKFLRSLYDLSVKIRADKFDCIGNFALINEKKFQKTLAILGINPELYKNQTPPNEIYDEMINQNRKIFKIYAFANAENLALYNQFNAEYKKSLNPLIEHFENFGFDNASAVYYAVRALNEYLSFAVANFDFKAKFSPLEEFVTNGNLSVESLSEFIYSANFNQNDLNNALNIALLRNVDTQILKFLISLGANLNTNDENSLFYAVNSAENLEFLIQNGANVNYKNFVFQTPIFAAIKAKNLQSVEILIKNQASLNIKTISNSEKMANGVNLCGFSDTSMTPLMFAAKYANSEILDVLIKNGADFKAVDENFNTALDYAIMAENAENIQFLKNLGLKENSHEILEF